MDSLKPKPNEVRLGDNQLEIIANGGSVVTCLPNGEEIIISQKLTQDIAEPLVEHERKIFSKAEIEAKRLGAIMANDMFQSNSI